MKTIDITIFILIMLFTIAGSIYLITTIIITNRKIKAAKEKRLELKNSQTNIVVKKENKSASMIGIKINTENKSIDNDICKCDQSHNLLSFY